MEAILTRTHQVKHKLKKLRSLLRPDAAAIIRRRLLSTQSRPLTSTSDRTRNRTVILAYHRVIRLASDPQLLCVLPERFAEQLEVLKRHFTIVPLNVLIERLRSGKPVAGMTALTFDDGYADNLLIAKPLLERAGAPATIFVASGQIGRRYGFWWDELERLLLTGRAVPRTLRLRVGHQVLRWNLDDDADGVIESGDSACEYGRSQPGATRQQVYRSLHRVLYALAPDEREIALEKLREWAGISGLAPAEHRILTAEELAQLSRSDLIEIGGHTISHPALCTLSVEQQTAEIAGGKRSLEESLGRPVNNFAYPYGSLASYDNRTVETVRAAGFRSGCTTFADIVRPGVDLFQLPRLLVRDWDGDEFERQLRARINHWAETT